MVEVRFFGLIKEENFFIKASDLKELGAILQEKEGLKEWLGVCTIALNDRLIDNLNTPLKESDVISLLPPFVGARC
ncbi:molybdenum cofactor biosynthesis protein MoaD [Helicobacter pylori]|uniref:MoaD/ThiS family protein n=1 Tax=Helicobacter pylori TaxID=210 RepID=UPI0004E9332C|nr:MoaD/ThiS family protein [Helicobacter pylori]KFH28159.1 molybdenum cofactor biosynthesis protein MoaD [Helicobacter pylori]